MSFTLPAVLIGVTLYLLMQILLSPLMQWPQPGLAHLKAKAFTGLDSNKRQQCQGPAIKAKQPCAIVRKLIHHRQTSQAVAGMSSKPKLDAASCKPLLTNWADSANPVVICAQRRLCIFSLFAYLSAFADFKVARIQPSITQMRGQSPAPLSCLKWGIDGELSTHDTALLINRLASSEKSRRGFKDHFERRQRGKASEQASPVSTTKNEHSMKATMTRYESPMTA